MALSPGDSEEDHVASLIRFGRADHRLAAVIKGRIHYLFDLPGRLGTPSSDEELAAGGRVLLFESPTRTGGFFLGNRTDSVTGRAGDRTAERVLLYRRLITTAVVGSALSDGESLVPIVDAASLLSALEEEGTPPIACVSFTRRESGPNGPSPEQYLRVRLGGTIFCVDTADASVVELPAKVAATPFCDPALAGITLREDRLVPVLRSTDALGNPQSSSVGVEWQNGETVLVLPVDESLGSVSLEGASLSRLPASLSLPWFRRVLVHGTGRGPGRNGRRRGEGAQDALTGTTGTAAGFPSAPHGLLLLRRLG